MASAVVYDDVADGANLKGQLFAGKKFWVAQRCPSRNHYIDLIKSNGGTVVLLEKFADYLIADHLTKQSPAGSISYKFIEESIKHGELQDPEAYPAGPPLGTVREAGVTSRPTKGGRALYTAEEDRILYKWVQDCKAAGKSTSGNEIYKQLELKHPRHTWQSWRDRYLKQLRDRPPTTVSVQVNAPPSPPSDQPAEQIPSTGHTSRPREESACNKVKEESKLDRAVRAVEIKEYSVEDLEKLFDQEDWEELYGNAESIKSSNVEGYLEGWENWAQGTHQTAEQWKQYYEKVVLPQWKRDGQAKRDQITEKVQRRHQVPEATEDSEPSPSNVAAEIEATIKRRSEKESATCSQIRSSTEDQHTPEYLANAYDKAVKRMRESDDTVESQEPSVTEPERKRRKSASPAPAPRQSVEQVDLTGTQQQPLEISSGVETSSISEGDDRDETEGQGNDQDVVMEEKAVEDTDVDRDTLSDLPSDTPTPRAIRHKPTAFDTQAILSSPSQDFPLTALPRPRQGLAQTVFQRESQSHVSIEETSSPNREQESIASSQSLQEFRQSLQETEGQSPELLFVPLPRPRHESVTPSEGSSGGSGDPDFPLEPDEIDDFYAEQNAEGFTDKEISAALKMTRCRPELTTMVLQASKEGKPLPTQRGIWSREEDADVESGDANALERLQRKHTLDGWGGITERLKWLEILRSRPLSSA